MRSFDSIFINGDSYSAPKISQLVYADHLGKIFDCPIDNRASPGSSNDRITRTTIEYVTQYLEQGHRPLVIVAWSFVRRCEVWYYGDRDIFLPDRNSLSQHSRLTTLDFLLQENIASMEYKAMVLPDAHIHKQLTDFYVQVYLLAHWLQQNKVPYLFFSAADNTDCSLQCFPSIVELRSAQWCAEQVCIYRLHEFSLSGWARLNDANRNTTNHLSEQGHKDFAARVAALLEETHVMV